MKEPPFSLFLSVFGKSLLPLVTVALLTMLAMDLRDDEASYIILPALAFVAAVAGWYNYQSLYHVFARGREYGLREGVHYARKILRNLQESTENNPQPTSENDK